MSAIVFIGPTISREDARNELDAIFLPPAAQGDVYRATQSDPRAIGIIDGYFDRVPAVWHKEILWAMSRGIYVFGSASMGALRAAELADFGMIGVGTVFMAFHRGEIEDDDEVAVIHGPADSGYRILSEAMVNIRATLNSAKEAGIVNETDARRLEDMAKQTPYASRTYRHLLSQAVEAGFDRNTLGRLSDWLPSGSINRKRLDAVGMLRAMKDFLATDPPRYNAKFTFEHTVAWEAARQRTACSRTQDFGQEDVLEEIRVSGAYGPLKVATLLRILAVQHAEAAGTVPGGPDVDREVERFRIVKGLTDADAFSHWCQAQTLVDPAEIHRLFASEASLTRADLAFRQEILARLPDELKILGEYESVLRRASRKRDLLKSRYLEHPTLSDAHLSEGELWNWYFEVVLGRAIPADLGAFAVTAGFDDVASFRGAVLREFFFHRLETVMQDDPAR